MFSLQSLTSCSLRARNSAVALGAVFALAAAGLADGPRGAPDEPAPLSALGAPLSASDAGVSDQFGCSVAISGDTAVVGAWLEDNQRGHSAGSAYIYRWDGLRWNEVAKLTAPDGAAEDRFGHAVAVHNDVIVVGSPLADVNGQSDAGAAYIFRRDRGVWRFEAKVVASDGFRQDRFGRAVGVSGAGIAVGAPREDRAGGVDQGAVYTFRAYAGTWFEVAKLVAPDAGSGDTFGFAIAMDGPLLAVGAQYNNAEGGRHDAGAAYLFSLVDSQWVLSETIRAAEPTLGANFGSSVALNAGVLVIGAERDSVAGVRAGSAFVFLRDDAGRWRQSARLVSTQPGEDDFFGSSVGVAGDMIVVGAEKADLGLVDAGSVQAFERVKGSDQWVGSTPFGTGLNQGNEFFGTSLAFDNGLLLVSAPLADLPQTMDAGVAFAFARDHDCNGDGMRDASQIAVGQLADLNANGIPDVCECLADWDSSGGLTSSDASAFVNDWFVDQAVGSLRADVNASGTTDATDVSDFINAYFEGCL